MEDEKFETSDLNFTAYLRTQDINFESFRVENGITIFVFKKNKKVEEAVNSFLKDGILKSFIQAQKDLKFLVKHPSRF